MTITLDEQTEEIQLAGNIGFWSVLALAVILGIHPFGTTDLYDDGQQFLEHVNAFWVTIHFLGAVAFLSFLVPVATWARNLVNARSRVIGKWALYVGIAGTAVGLIHLVATDTTVFIAFADTFAAGAGSEATTVAADLLLRLHAATLTAWTLSYFIAFPALLGWAARADGRFPNWYPWVSWIGALLAVAAVVVTMAQGQWTTLSEMGLFRPSVVLLILWLVITTWWMRKGSLIGVGETVEA